MDVASYRSGSSRYGGGRILVSFSSCYPTLLLSFSADALPEDRVDLMGYYNRNDPAALFFLLQKTGRKIAKMAMSKKNQRPQERRGRRTRIIICCSNTMGRGRGPDSIGHPCCGRTPLARHTVSARAKIPDL